MKENAKSRRATFATFPRGDFEDDFENFIIKIFEFKKSSYNSSNLLLEENIHFSSNIIRTKP